MAMFNKRFCIYRRNYKSLLVEIFIPVLLVLLGFAFSKIQFYFDSPDRTLTTDLLPAKQRILVNTDLVRKSSNDISPRTLIEGLPNYA